ncbi:23S rRNA (pseudouridine(1915)-N(3))-methyltransferase RlmH, partial [Xylella fastidiosa subsp. multiplex]|nr:23S rRNA (pseudouridine(1915)-N(3))-methyltransferase RlmH [Xylella fastidiosa subsp. multiplex]
MKCLRIATGERDPTWVGQGLAEYHRRLSYWLPCCLVEIE